MANRFSTPVVGEYVRQYTPDLIDYEFMNDMAATKQLNHDTLIGTITKGHKPIEYVNMGLSAQEAQRLDAEYGQEYQNMASDLLASGDIRGVTRTLADVVTRYNSDPVIKQLAKEKEQFTADMERISKETDKLSAAPVTNKYISQYKNVEEGQQYYDPLTKQFIERSEPTTGVFADTSQAINALTTSLRGNTHTLANGEKVKFVTDPNGNLVGFNQNSRETVQLTADDVRNAAKVIIENNPSYMATKGVTDYVDGEGAYDKNTEVLMEAAINSVPWIESTEVNKFIDLPEVVVDGSGGGDAPSPSDALPLATKVSTGTFGTGQVAIKTAEEFEKNLTTAAVELTREPSASLENGIKPSPNYQVIGKHINTMNEYASLLRGTSLEQNDANLADSDFRDENGLLMEVFTMNVDGYIAPMGEDAFFTEGELLQVEKEMGVEKGKELRLANAALRQRNTTTHIFNAERAALNNTRRLAGAAVGMPKGAVDTINRFNTYLDQGKYDAALETLTLNIPEEDAELHGNNVEHYKDLQDGDLTSFLDLTNPPRFTKSGDLRYSYPIDRSSTELIKALDKEDIDKTGLTTDQVRETFSSIERKGAGIVTERDIDAALDYYLKSNEIGRGDVGNLEELRHDIEVDLIANSPDKLKAEVVNEMLEYNNMTQEEAELQYDRVVPLYRSNKVQGAKQSYIGETAKKFLKQTINKYADDATKQGFGIFDEEFDKLVEQTWKNEMNTLQGYDYANNSYKYGTAEIKEDWIKKGYTDILTNVDAFQNRLIENPIGVFEGADAVFDLRTNKNITMTYALAGGDGNGSFTISREDYREAGATTEIDNTKYSITGIDYIPDIGAGVIVHVKSTDEDDNNAMGSDIFLAHPDMADAYLAQILIDKDIDVTQNLEVTAAILENMTDAMKLSSTNTMKKLPVGSQGDFEYFVDVVPTSKSNSEYEVTSYMKAKGSNTFNPIPGLQPQTTELPELAAQIADIMTRSAVKRQQALQE